MKLTWLGHAAFALEHQGVRLCIDPHAPGVLGGRFRLPAIAGPFDAIVVTHSHEDHLAWRPALGTDRIVDSDARVGPFEVQFRAAPHDGCCGAQMGWTRMALVRVEGMGAIVHCGDAGALNEDHEAWLGTADTLLVPVGGTYTMAPERWVDLLGRLPPVRVVPMHYSDPRVDLPLLPVSDFTAALGWPEERLDQLHWPLELEAPICVHLTAPETIEPI